jgi:deferrochelatase/peroxidase EfeB
LPKNLRPPNVFDSVDPAGGGGKVLEGSGLNYARGLPLNPATEEICVQFTGDTPLSVSRAVVETWKLLEAARDAKTGKAALLLSASFTGFNREDERSWLGFHDGVSNLPSGNPRKAVIAIKRQGLPPRDSWTVDGAYMAFIRLTIDLKLWEELGREEQELLVGRTKISGCPLLARHVAGHPQTAPGCPAAGTFEVTDDVVPNRPFREPPDGVDADIVLSHVQRANHHQDRQRIFRQGYEFLEAPIPGRPLSVGLNFVSFQDNPERLLFILRTESWLGSINFGGDPGPELLSATAAAIFLCPPRQDGELFPGASIFPLAVASGPPTGQAPAIPA